MLPFRIVSNTINDKKIYRHLTRIPLVTNWGWLIFFVTISVFNGWMIHISEIKPFFVSETFVSQAFLKQIVTIYFAIFPLAATAHNFFKKTWVLITTIIGSRAILALALCYFKLPPLNSLSIGFLIFNIFLFSIVLIFVSRTRGIIVPAFILFLIILLFVLDFGGLVTLNSLEWAFHLVWYCNLVVTVNKAGRRLRYTLGSFDAAMLSLSGIAALGLSLGWLMSSFSS